MNGPVQVTVDIDAPVESVFCQLADIERLAEWAPAFCATIQVGRAGWRIVGAAGEFGVELIATERTGVILIEVQEPTSGPADVFTVWIAARAGGGTRVRLAPFLGSGRPGSDRARRVFPLLATGLAGLRERYSCLS